jgi:hypothetical protein
VSHTVDVIARRTRPGDPWAWLESSECDDRDGLELVAAVLDRWGAPSEPADVLRRAELLVEERPRAAARGVFAAAVEIHRVHRRLEQRDRRIHALTLVLLWALAFIAMLVVVLLGG